MVLVNRVVELLGQGKPLDRAEEIVRHIDEVFQNLDSIGKLARLVDELGGDAGLSKGWLRSEVLKSLPPAPAAPERHPEGS